MHSGLLLKEYTVLEKKQSGRPSKEANLDSRLINEARQLT